RGGLPPAGRPAPAGAERRPRVPDGQRLGALTPSRLGAEIQSVPLHVAPLRVPVSRATARITPGLTPPPQAFSVSLRPRATMFLAALRSRSCTAPQAEHAHSRTLS